MKIVVSQNNDDKPPLKLYVESTIIGSPEATRWTGERELALQLEDHDACIVLHDEQEVDHKSGDHYRTWAEDP